MTKASTVDAKVDLLTALVEKGFAASADDITSIADDVASIKERMATKEDLKQFANKDEVREIAREVIREELRPIHHELREISRRLDTLEEHYANLKGVTKEIDEIRAEVRAIQKHLGIERKIAA